MTDQFPMTRRDFVRTSAATTAAALVAPGVIARPRSMDTVRVGLIGCGGRGTGAAAQAIRADKNAVLTAMGDVFMERVDQCVGNLSGDESLRDKISVDTRGKFAGIDAYKQVIDSGVDVVILATPPVFRPQHLAYAIAQNKHVFCEKPVAVDAPGVRSALVSTEEAARRGLALVSGFCWRYNAGQRAFYEQLHAGQIGDVRAITTTYNTGPLGDVPRQPGWSDMEWQLRNWKAFIWASGDHIVEQAIHSIDWIHWAMQGALPTRAFAVGGRQCRDGEWSGDMYDHFSVVYEFASGARGFHMCRQMPNCDNDNTAYVMGSSGTGFSNPWNTRSLRLDGATSWRFEGENNDMYQQEHDELFASIRNGTPINDGKRMAESTMMGIMGRMAAYTGRTLTWEQCLRSEESLTPTDYSWGDRPMPEVPMPSQLDPR